jgi:hypothetical protein
MKYFDLVTKTTRDFIWIFFEQIGEEPLRLRPRYKALQCRTCGKFDEAKALGLGFDPNLRVHSKQACFISADGVFCVTEEFRSILRNEGIGGANFIEVPGTSYWVMVPTELVETDVIKAGFKFEPPQCPSCARYRGVYRRPWTGAMRVPEDPWLLFASEVWNEDERVRITWFIASETVVKTLKRAAPRILMYNEN